MRMRDDLRSVYTYGYLDESGTSNRWFACGLLLHGPKVSGVEDVRLNEYIRSLKAQAGLGLSGDVGWKKVPTKPGNYLTFYQRCVEGFLNHPNLAFHTIVIDTHRYPLDSKTFFRGSKDIGMDAFAFHLIRYAALRRWSGAERLYIRFDRRNRPDETSLADVSRRLSRIMPRSARVNLRSVNGGKHPLLHITDLLLGSVTATLNGKTTSPGRLELLRLLERGLGRSPAAPTPPWEPKFNVWMFEPGKIIKPAGSPSLPFQL